MTKNTLINLIKISPPNGHKTYLDAALDAIGYDKEVFATLAVMAKIELTELREELAKLKKNDTIQLIEALKNMIKRTHHCGEEMPWDGRDGPDPLDVAKELIERLTDTKN